jgi:tRNA(Ile2) C34 agmatinyltransferase TiaS
VNEEMAETDRETLEKEMKRSEYSTGEEARSHISKPPLFRLPL